MDKGAHKVMPTLPDDCGLGAPALPGRRGLSRLAVICDYPDEGWFSMDLCAEMLLSSLRANHAAEVHARRICPPFRRRWVHLPVLGRRRWAFNADRLMNRLLDYPRHLRHRVAEYDLFHLCDHSYAHLVHALPAGRTGVHCHDLNLFRCLLEPARERRPRWFQRISRHVLRGLQKAALVFYSTQDVRRGLEKFGLVDPARLVHAPYGIAPEFLPDGDEPSALPDPCKELERSGRPFLLHVGSCDPRKRMDVLLDVFAGCRARCRELVLVKVGGPWTRPQRQQIERLGIEPAVLQLCGLERQAIACLYRRARMVLQPSEAEGFGLPIIEALACGSVVVASDIPVLREVGAEAAVYCPVGDVAQWVATVCQIFEDPALAPDRCHRLARARQFSWSAHSATILEAYEGLL